MPLIYNIRFEYKKKFFFCEFTCDTNFDNNDEKK